MPAQRTGRAAATSAAKRPFVGFRSRRAAAPVPAATAAPARNPEAMARLLARFPDIGARFGAMSEAEFGDWLDALPFDEFLEYVGLGAQAIAQALRPYLADTACDTPDTGEGGQGSLPVADIKGRTPGRRRVPARTPVTAGTAASDETTV